MDEAKPHQGTRREVHLGLHPDTWIGVMKGIVRAKDSARRHLRKFPLYPWDNRPLLKLEVRPIVSEQKGAVCEVVTEYGSRIIVSETTRLMTAQRGSRYVRNLQVGDLVRIRALPTSLTVERWRREFLRQFLKRLRDYGDGRSFCWFSSRDEAMDIKAQLNLAGVPATLFERQNGFWSLRVPPGAVDQVQRWVRSRRFTTSGFITDRFATGYIQMEWEEPIGQLNWSEGDYVRLDSHVGRFMILANGYLVNIEYKKREGRHVRTDPPDSAGDGDPDPAEALTADGAGDAGTDRDGDGPDE